MPPATLTNDDLSTIMDTSDEWIFSRTGMKERRISHVNADELAYVAAARAIAAAGLEVNDIDGILFGSMTPTTLMPNCSSYVQKRLGNKVAACMDLNSACCSFLYAISTATSLIQAGVMNKVVVIGAEKLSWFLDWTNRNVSVLFGDGAGAVVLEATSEPVGVLSSKLGCYGDMRDTLATDNFGSGANRGLDSYAHISWEFDGQEIFKRATRGMVLATQGALADANVDVEEVDWVIPHQANRRIIEAVAKRMNIDMDRVAITVDRYANTSAATIPVTLTEILEQKRIQPYDKIVMPAFGAGLTWGAAYLRWGARVEPIAEAAVELPPCDKTALELIEPLLEINRRHKVVVSA
ncbi:ketoacyl-ACP synthase III [Pleionea sp. CnH1-48]|nr:ketoacyl-ACP synthase III [Pleionea sp. CnH1-48]